MITGSICTASHLTGALSTLPSLMYNYSDTMVQVKHTSRENVTSGNYHAEILNCGAPMTLLVMGYIMIMMILNSHSTEYVSYDDREYFTICTAPHLTGALSALPCLTYNYSEALVQQKAQTEDVSTEVNVTEMA